jgi:hypothetical protein
MGRKRTRTDRERRSPNATVADISEELLDRLGIPELNANVPERLAAGLAARVEALLFHLDEAKRQSYVRALEIRLVREAFGAVLAAYELDLNDSEVWYARFRRLVEELGYQRVDVGFTKPREPTARLDSDGA